MAQHSESEFRFDVGRQRSDMRRRDAPTMRITILADLSGRAGRIAAGSDRPIAQRHLVRVDVDNFADVLARVEPRLVLRLGGPDSPEIPIVVRHLDDFHPDTLYQNLELFGPIRDVRRRLLNTSTFPDAAAEWSASMGLGVSGNIDTTAKASPPSEDDKSTHLRLLGQGSATFRDAQPTTRAQAGLDRLLREVIAPHIVPAADPRLPELLRSVDDTASRLLRAILHSREWQAVESVWRSVYDLVTGIETDAGVELQLLDVTRAELQDEKEMTALDRLLTDPEADAGTIWPLIVAASTFGPSAEDVLLLQRLGTMAERLGGPVLAGADPSLIGCRSFADASDPSEWAALDAAASLRWHSLRESGSATFIGLAMPRVILRLPYGKRTDPIEAFDFEELSPGRDHEAYLWGNPAFACAHLIASSFVENGDAMEPGDHLELEDLPAAVFDDDEGPSIKPCAETALSERAAHRILESGIMPLLASTRRNVLRIMRLQSIAAPSGRLDGPWSRSSSEFDR